MAASNLKEITRTSSNRFVASLLYNVTIDLTSGNRDLVHFEIEKDLESEQGALGRLMKVAETLQESWTNDAAWSRMLYRLTFLEQITDLFLSWGRGIVGILSLNLYPSFVQRKRTIGRALQFLVGTFALYAMATWWDDYSSLLGSSSTGQWTMVAFYVCFRATAKETMHAGIIRAIGHGLGAMFSWGMNTAVESSSGRIGCHLAITLVGTWLIPPPFSVTPSGFKFTFDVFFTSLLEAMLTTYHLTSVLVLSTDIESATKARALSQCIGARTAVLVSMAILPWFAVPQARKTLEKFNDQSKASLAKLGEENNNVKKAAFMSVENVLQARRDVASAQEAAGWITSLFEKKDLNSDFGESLTRAAFGLFAVEAIVRNVQNMEESTTIESHEKLASALKASQLDDALSLIRESPPSSEETSRNVLATLYVEVLLLQESTLS